MCKKERLNVLSRSFLCGMLLVVVCELTQCVGGGVVNRNWL